MSPLLLAAGALFLAQLTYGVAGFGAMLVGVPLLSLIYGPQEAIFLASCCSALAGASLVVRARRDIDLRVVAAAWLPMVAGQVIGTALLMRMSERMILIVLGVAVISVAGPMVIRPVRPGRGELEALPSPSGSTLGWLSIGGLLGGIMAGATGAGGPPIVVVMKRFFADRFFRAQLVLIFTLGASSLVALLTWRGVGSLEVASRVPWLLLPVFGGAWLGARIAPRLPRATFGRFIGGMLVVMGAGLIAKAI